MAHAFVFPGQGSQAVGMGKALADAFPVARATFEEVDEALGEKLSSLMWDGPLDRADIDRKHPARVDGSFRGGVPSARERGWR